MRVITGKRHFSTISKRQTAVDGLEILTGYDGFVLGSAMLVQRPSSDQCGSTIVDD